MSFNTSKRYRGVKYQPITSSLGEAAHYASGRVSSLRQRIPAYVLPLFLFLLVAAGALPFLWHGSPSGSAAATQDDQIAIRLHPEDHVARQPKTLTFDFTISQGVRAIGGVEKQIYLVNDAFPGPTIEARSGDRIIVNVQNNLPDEGVSLHWHGLRMKDYNHMDGAVGITQCPIASNKTFSYDFKIGDDEHGTFWWHSHVGVQRGDGLYGGLVVHEPSVRRAVRGPEYLLLVGDWFHGTQKNALGWFNDIGSMGMEPVPESLVVNAHGRYNCSMAVPARPIVCSQVPLASELPILSERKDAKLRVINVGTVAGVSMAVGGATLQATAVDGGWPIQANRSDLLGIVYPGQRVDAALKWDDVESEDSWLSVYLDEENFGYHNPALEGQQAFAMLPTTRHGEVAPEPKDLDTYKEQAVLASAGSSSSLARPLPSKADMTFVMYTKIEILAHLGNKPQGSINQTAWKPQSKPLLASAKQDWDAKQLVPFIPFDASKPKHIDIVVNNLDDGAHPFHFHGNPFYVLASYGIGKDSGWGSYNPFEDEKAGSPLNHVDPVRRDTVVVPRHGHVVLRFIADSPGMWFFHCHMMVHMGTGMAGTLHVGDADDQDNARTLNQQAAQLCPV